MQRTSYQIEPTDAGARWAERVRCLEDAQILAWLQGEPLYRHTLLTLAQDESKQRSFALAGRTPSDQELIDAERTHVLRYFTATIFGACPICYFAPVVTFTDGRAIEYPALAIHRCDGLGSSPAWLSKRQPAWKRGAASC